MNYATDTYLTLSAIKHLLVANINEHFFLSKQGKGYLEFKMKLWDKESRLVLKLV